MKNKLSVNSMTFITITTLYFGFVLNLKFWQQCFDIIHFDNFMSVMFVISLPLFICLPLFLLFNIITVKYIGKPIIVILLLCSAISAYTMQYLGIVINSDMIANIVETNIREATDLVTSSALLFVFFIGILPAIAIILVKINYDTTLRETKKRLKYVLYATLSLLLFAPITYKAYAGYCRNNSQIRHSLNTLNYIAAVNKYHRRIAEKNMKFQILDENPVKMLSKKNAPRVVVLVVGETARAANFSLYGYEKETNPLLAQNQDVITFKNVLSCGTATGISVPCMFSAGGQSKFDKVKARHTQNLNDIIKLSGYHITWLDNDDGCKNVCDRIDTINMQKKKTEDCFGDYCYDSVFFDELDDRLSKITEDTVLVLHAMGSHGPTYYKRYPDEFKKFQPTCDTADLHKCTNEEIVNTYDNTILYTDYVLDSVIKILKKHNNLSSSMLYVSDHGESLGEHNIYLHAFPYKTAPKEQKEIPMILWLSDAEKVLLNINTPRLKKKAETDKFSHDNYFHSVLGLLQINTNTYNKKLDIFADIRS